MPVAGLYQIPTQIHLCSIEKPQCGELFLFRAAVDYNTMDMAIDTARIGEYTMHLLFPQLHFPLSLATQQLWSQLTHFGEDRVGNGMLCPRARSTRGFGFFCGCPD